MGSQRGLLTLYKPLSCVTPRAAPGDPWALVAIKDVVTWPLGHCPVCATCSPPPPPNTVIRVNLLQEVVLCANVPVVCDTEIDINIPCMLM